MAQLVLGGLDEETAFVEFDVDCDADIILGYDWLRAHDLAFLYDTDQACFCAERCCVSGRRVRLDLTLDQLVTPALPLSHADLRALLGSAGLGPVPTLGRPSHWAPATRRSAMAATLTTAVEAAWAADTVAGLADAGTTLADGTELLVGSIAFAVRWALSSRSRPTGAIFLPVSSHPPASPLNSATCLGVRPPAALRTAAPTSSCASRRVLTPCPAHDQ